MRSLAAEGRTVFVSSHILSEVEHACDRVAIVAHGKCVASGRVSELLQGTNARFRVRVDDPQRTRRPAPPAVGRSRPTATARSVVDVDAEPQSRGDAHARATPASSSPSSRRSPARSKTCSSSSPRSRAMRQLDAELRRFFARRIVRGLFLVSLLIVRARRHRRHRQGPSRFTSCRSTRRRAR